MMKFHAVILLTSATLLGSACTSVSIAWQEGEQQTQAPRTDTAHVEEKLLGEKNTELAKKTQNPIANMVSLPFQNNTQYGVGTADRTANTLNIQPIIPTKLSADWLLINRVVLPIVTQPGMVPAQSTESGLGDTLYTGWFAPMLEGNVTVGLGPAVQIPTHTDDRLGNDHWGLGPSVVVVAMMDAWVVGGLINNVWSVGGSSDPSYNQMLIQPFVNYNLGDGWYLVTAPIMTANWEASSSETWTIPLGGGGGKVFRIGKQPVNVNLQFYYNVEKPTLVGDWSSRLQIQFPL
jgi:hypothetical protein